MIDYNSSPDYDDWGWDKYWSCNDWIEWYEALKNQYGRGDAQRRWKSAWFDPQNDTWLWDKSDSCAYDVSFVDYFNREGISVTSNLVSEVARDSIKLSTKIRGTVFGTIGKAADGIDDTATIVFKILPWVVVGLVLIYGLSIAAKNKTVITGLFKKE